MEKSNVPNTMGYDKCIENMLQLLENKTLTVVSYKMSTEEGVSPCKRLVFDLRYPLSNNMNHAYGATLCITQTKEEGRSKYHSVLEHLKKPTSNPIHSAFKVEKCSSVDYDGTRTRELVGQLVHDLRGGW